MRSIIVVPLGNDPKQLMEENLWTYSWPNLKHIRVAALINANHTKCTEIKKIVVYWLVTDSRRTFHRRAYLVEDIPVVGLSIFVRNISKSAISNKPGTRGLSVNCAIETLTWIQRLRTNYRIQLTKRGYDIPTLPIGTGKGNRANKPSPLSLLELSQCNAS